MENESKVKMIFSVILFVCLALVIWIFWPVVEGFFTGQKYLSPSEGQELYDKGYADGSHDLEDLTKLYQDNQELLNYLNSLYSDCLSENDILKSEIDKLEQEQVELLKAIDQEGVSIITYTVNGEIVNCEWVQTYTKLNSDYTIENTDEYLFKGWSLDGENLINTIQFEPTGNTELKAVLYYL